MLVSCDMVVKNMFDFIGHQHNDGSGTGYMLKQPVPAAWIVLFGPVNQLEMDYRKSTTIC